ncbi:MAG: DNA polymerase I [Arenicellaceae bacterium]|nr:DNA polymerase I [Arenicellaceae bacterium]
MPQKQLILIDGSSYLFRAFFQPALKRFFTEQGQPTGAVFGVVNMLKSLLAEYQPDYVGVVFDAKGKNFRHELYEQYKANRPPMPDELRSQIDYVHKVIKALGLPLISVPGVEADDVLGTLARQGAEEGLSVIVSTGDKDLAQIVNDSVVLIDTMKNARYDIDGVVEKYGVRPDQIIDYLALIGDSSDNVPGVPKVGPKTAVKWLEQYDSLDSIVEHANDITGKVGENLREFLPELPLSKDLVTIRCELGLDFGLDDLVPEEQDIQGLADLYNELDFKKWRSELNLGSVSESISDKIVESELPTEYDIVLDKESFGIWLKRLKEAELFAFDTETTSLNFMSAELVGVSFSVETGSAAYVPVAHSYMGAPAQLSRDYVLEQLKPLLEDKSALKVGQNLKYDSSILANYDIELAGIAYDTMLESYLLNSVANRHDMDTLAMRHLGIKTTKFEEVAGKGKSQITFDQVSLDQAGPYAAEDADITLRLHHSIMPKLAEHKNQAKLFHTLEIPLLSVLSKMERNGVYIDSGMLLLQSQQLAARMQELELLAHQAAGGDFNLSSPKQIQEILFKQLKLPVIRKTPKGQPSTAEDVLQELAEEHDLPRIIVEHRGLGKLKSTYTDKLPMLVNLKTNRVHTSYQQAVTATGRLSSTDPNLQNIPIRTVEGRRIREAFIPEPGNILVAADYSQVELRIMAHLSGDTTLVKAFRNRADIHSATAAEVFDCPLLEVTSDQRRSAKAINFGLIYGMSAFGLAKQLGVHRGEAQDYINVYFERYPGVKEYMDSTRVKARESGYVETVYGRRLYLPDIKASNGARRQYAERTAINAPMQGTAADLIKMAMLAVDKWTTSEAPEVKMIMQVHDELVFELPENQQAEVIEKVCGIMAGVGTLSVPLIVEAGAGANWALAH